jgi:acetyltransferase
MPDDTSAEKRPLAPIEPYPSQYTTSWQLPNGQVVIIRPIRPEDEALLSAHHATLSERTIHMRFFSMVKLLSRESLIRLCHLDYARDMALVAERHTSAGRAELVGVSRYYMDPATREAEFAVVVTDALQHQGLGRHLMERLIAVARDRGVKRLVGYVLRENTPMLAFVRKLGFHEVREVDDSAVEVALDM